MKFGRGGEGIFYMNRQAEQVKDERSGTHTERERETGKEGGGRKREGGEDPFCYLI